MIRLAGILLGSTLAVAILLALFGVPRFERQSTPSDSGVITLPLQSAVSQANPTRRTDSQADTIQANPAEPEALPAEPTQAAETPAGPATEAGGTEYGRSGLDVPGTSLAGSERIDTYPDNPGEGPTEPEAIETHPEHPGEGPAGSEAVEALQWYAFWSPFRSEIAATGFITQLQRVTGLDYRVVKVKPGVYEVAFAYNDGEELTASLSQISRATGLDMPDE